MDKINAIRYKRAERKIYELVKSAVLSGVVRLPTESSLAKNMGISIGTVRNAINNLREKNIIKSYQGKGTFLSEEVLQGQKTVALIWGLSSESNLKSPWLSLLHQNLVAQFESKGWKVITYNLFHYNSEIDKRAYKQLCDDMEGMKFCTAIKIDLPEIGEEYIARMKWSEQSVPLLSITASNLSSNAIIVDYYALGYEGVKYLVSKGAKKIGCIGCNLTDGSTNYDFWAGFRNAKFQFGVPSEIDAEILTDLSVEGARVAFKNMWTSGGKFEGLVVTDDVLLIGVVCGMLELGIRCPEDLIIISLGVEGAMEVPKYDPPRLVFSPQHIARLACMSAIQMASENLLICPSLKVLPYLSEKSERVYESIKSAAATESNKLVLV